MVYKKYNIEGIVSVSPNSINSELEEILKNQLSKEYEGLIDKDIGLIVCVTDLLDHDEGEIIPEDYNVFFKVKFSVITFMPKLHELVLGRVTQATDFGAFINIGPFEGLCHVSQVMPDYNSFNPELLGFVAKDSNRSIEVEDEVIARIANISMKNTLADTKVGITMRQDGLGKREWWQDTKSAKKTDSKTTKKSTSKKKGGKK